MPNPGPAAEQRSCNMQDENLASVVPSPTTQSSSKTHSLSSSFTAAAAPARTFFDPWNTSSTGHQRAENRLSGSTSWRDSRNRKLSEQYKSGPGGGRRVADTVGQGSADFGKDGRKANGGWERGAKGLRANGQKSLAELWGASKALKKAPQGKESERVDYPSEDSDLPNAAECENRGDDISFPYNEIDIPREPLSKGAEKHVFDGLCFYLNGSTAPLVSDHKLKHLLAANGAKTSIALSRRSVTHVILGNTHGKGGCGGGLAATKIQKEITRTRGMSVKFVTAEWVLESIKANRRLAESRFSPLSLAPRSQSSVMGMLGPSKQDQG